MRLFHLSDLHYGRRDANRSAHFFTTDPTRRTPRPETLATAVIETAAQRRPAAIVVSGDIAWSGVQEDYDFAFTFLDTVRTRLGIPIVIAPGNHDVDWSAPSDAERQDAYIAFVQRFYDAEFATFFPHFDATSDRRRYDLTSLHRIGQATIITVNSAAAVGPAGPRCGMCDKPRQAAPPILVDPTALTYWEDQLRGDDDLRILVIHHHLLPFKESHRHETVDPMTPEDRTDDTLVANSARVQAWLAAHRFTMVLHGHKHRAHVRYDVLATRHDEQMRDIVVLGAGSAGVHEDERAGDDPLSFYVVDAQPLRRGVYNVRVDTFRIDAPDLRPRVVADSPRVSREVGQQRPDSPRVFHAADSARCYEAIASNASDGRMIKNFVSIIDEPTFILPPGAQLRGVPVTREMVEKSFLTLHPEYDQHTGWTDPNTIRERLATQPQRFRFQHGNRLFAIPALVTPRGPTQFVEPLELAINKLGSSRAYAGLYNAFIDGHEGQPKQPPPPCLVGIQFILDSTANVLHLVATFRKLELSFWWLVNIFEMHRILEHAANSQAAGAHPRLGSITFYAALAEWKGADPGPTFSAELDELDTPSVVELALSATLNDNSKLRSLLQNKLDVTNDDNIDERGLDLLADTMKAFLPVAPGRLDPAFVQLLREAADALTIGRQAPAPAATHLAVLNATQALARAIAMLL